MLMASRSSTKGLIRDLDLMQAANKGILLGLPITAASMAKLSETAVVLGKAMGQGPTKSFDDLITALGRSSPMILDNLGLNVKVGEANEKYAKSLGKTAEQLTEAEMKMAFYNAAMDAASEKVEALGGVQLTMLDHVTRLKVRFENFTDALGVAVATSPAVNAVFESLADAIDGAVGDSQVDLVRKLTLYINEMALSVVTFLGDLVRAAAVAEKVGALARMATGQWGTARQDSSIMMGDSDLQRNAEAMGKRIEELRLKLEGLRNTTADTNTVINKLAGNDGNGGLPPVTRELSAAAKAAQAWADQVTGRSLNSELTELYRRYMALGGASAMTAHEWMNLGKQLVDMREKGALLPPVFDELADAYQRVSFAQKFGVDMGQQYVASLQRTTQQIKLSVADMTAVLNSKIMPLGKAPQMGPMLTYGKPDPSAAEQYGKMLGETIVSAAAGGGNVGEAVGSQIGFDLGSKLSQKAGSTISKVFGKTIGGAISAALPGIGAFLGPLAGALSGWVVGLFTGGEGAKANDLRDGLKKQFADAVRGLENDPEVRNAMNRFNTAGSRKDVQGAFDDAMKAAQEVKDVMGKYGLTLDDVADASTRLSRKTDTLKGDIGNLRGAGFSMQQITKGMAGEFNGLLMAAMETGQQLPAAFAPYLKEMATAGLLTDEVKRKLLGMADPTPWREMEEAANRYGISLDALGTKFQQAKIDDAAKQLAADWKLLADNGADINAVMGGMKDEVNALIGKALTLGLTIPESMKPLITAMFDAGVLVDENGKKLEDLGRVNFAPDILSDFDLLILKIDELIDKLTDGLYPALSNIPSPGMSIPDVPSQPSHGNPQYDENGNPVDTAHTGGMVVAGGIRKHHKGTSKVIPFPNLRNDEVPAILQTGEAVLNRNAAARIGESSIKAMNNGQMTGTYGGGEIVINITNQLDGAAIGRNQVRRNLPEAVKHMRLDRK
jgi:hypothetical protein